MIADVVLDQSMVRWALHANTLIAIRDLRYVSCKLLNSDSNLTYLVIVNPVVFADGINAIITTEIGSTNSEMVYFDVSAELEDEVELWTIDQDEIVEARIDWRYNSNEAGALRTCMYQYSRNKSVEDVGRLTCWHCGIRSPVLGWRPFRCSNKIRNQWLWSLSMPRMTWLE